MALTDTATMGITLAESMRDLQPWMTLADATFSFRYALEEFQKSDLACRVKRADRDLISVSQDDVL